jgi:hypothetical protein
VSWTEKAVVISSSYKLVVRTKYGNIHKLDCKEEYQEGSTITLVFSSTGNTYVLEDRHAATTSQSPLPPEIPDIIYEDLDYVE